VSGGGVAGERGKREERGGGEGGIGGPRGTGFGRVSGTAHVTAWAFRRWREGVGFTVVDLAAVVVVVKTGLRGGEGTGEGGPSSWRARTKHVCWASGFSSDGVCGLWFVAS